MRRRCSLVATAGLLALAGCATRGADPAVPDAAWVYNDMRLRALTLSADSVRTQPVAPSAPRVWGVLMDFGVSGGTATVVAFEDGTTSLYLSRGGSVIGATGGGVEHASDAFLAAAEARLNSMQPAGTVNGYPLPEPGRIRFYLRTVSGVMTADADDEELAAGTHPLSTLYAAGRQVVAAIRSTR